MRLQPLGHLSSTCRHGLIRRQPFAKRLSGPAGGFPQVSGDIYELAGSRRAAGRPDDELAGGLVRLADLMNGARYERAGVDLATSGLYVDLPPWGYHVFEVETA